jgi:uncharacterized protein YbbK (DUF523 family)
LIFIYNHSIHYPIIYKNEYSFITLNFLAVNDYFYKSGIIQYGMSMEKILISACLAGELVRYDARLIPISDNRLKQWEKEGRLVPVCPEVAGGLSTPRPPAQIQSGAGDDLAIKQVRVTTIDGRDVTTEFIKGAEYALSLVKKHKIKIAILKEKSPSCGVEQIYDGSFTEKKIAGSGVTSALLKQHGVKVFSEHQIKEAEDFLHAL